MTAIRVRTMEHAPMNRILTFVTVHLVTLETDVRGVRLLGDCNVEWTKYSYQYQLNLKRTKLPTNIYIYIIIENTDVSDTHVFFTDCNVNWTQPVNWTGGNPIVYRSFEDSTRMVLVNGAHIVSGKVCLLQPVFFVSINFRY